MSRFEEPEPLVGPREVARQTGVSTDTLRHYEKRGLLPEVHRTGSGYRRYSADTVSRVLLIQRALVIGFSLDELARVLRERDKGGAPCRSVRLLVGQRLDALDRQLEELVALRTDLRALVAGWDAQLAQASSGRRVYLLESLAGRAPIDGARKRRADNRAMKRLSPALRWRSKK
jgi:DNA-binding transcriptional MerR regulator